MTFTRGTNRGALLAVLVFALALVGHPALTHAGLIPTDLPGCRLWLDGSDASTLWKDTAATQPVTATGDLVARWNDKSGNSFFLSQGTVANQPTYQAASLNGLSTLYFNADNLNRTNNIGVNGNGDRTVIAVWANAVNTGQNYQHTFHMGNAATSQAYGHSAYRPGATGKIGNHYWGSGFDTTAVGTSSPTIALSMWDGDGGSPARDQWYVNGVDVGANNRATIDTGTNSGAIIVGSRLSPQTEGVQGNIAEVLIYDRDLTTDERSKVGCYLGMKWGVPSSYTWPTAGTLTWNAGADGQWATPNWTPSVGGLPTSPNEDVAAVINTPWTVTVPAAGSDAAAGSLSLSGNGSLAVGGGRTLTVMNGLTGAAGSSLALGSGSTLVLGQTGSLDLLTTSGNATLKNLKNLAIAGFSDNGIAGTLRLDGVGGLSINAATADAVVAKNTNFQVQPGSTLSVGGAGLLGGDPLVTLNGGTFTIAPVPAHPAYPSAIMMETDVSVLANSTLNAATTGTVALGRLAFNAPSILNVTGSGKVNFLDTTLSAGGTSGLNTAIRTVTGGLSSSTPLATTLAKQGSADLIVDPGSTFASTGLGNTLVDVQAGRLALIGANAAPGAAIRLSGGSLILGSPDGTNQTFANAITSTANGTLTAGAAGVGVASGDIAVSSLAPGAGTTISLAAEGAHTLVLPSPVSAAGSLAITQGTVRVTNGVSVASLSSNSGTTLATEGNVAIAATGGIALSGQLLVNSGSLTLNMPAGAPPAGAVGYWKFDVAGNLGLDSAGSYNGTLLSNNGGALPQPAAGKIGGAIDFERDNQDYIDLPDGFANFTNGITVSAWVNYESFTNWNRIIDFGNGPSSNNILLARNGTSANVHWEFQGTAGGTEAHEVANTGPNNQWLHVACTVAPGAANAAVSTMYINGVAVGVKPDHSLPSNVTRTINYIGRSNWADDYLDAVMDELIIYNRTLGGQEVQALYQAGVVGNYNPSLGDVRLARTESSATQVTFGGVGQPVLKSAGIVGGPTVTGPMTLTGGAKTLTANILPASPLPPDPAILTLDATVAASNFTVTGPGTVAMPNGSSLALNANGTLAVNPGATLASTGTVNIDASASGTRLAMAGSTLDVGSGTLTFVMPTGTTGALPRGAVAYYAFNDPSSLGRDMSGTGNNLTSVGSPAYSAAGAVGGALDLNGASRLTSATFPTGVPTGGGAYTLSAWINPNAGAGAWGILGWGNWGTTNQTNALRMVNSTQVINYWWGNDLTATAPGDLTTGTPPAGWHHVVATYDPSLGANQHQIYIDGVLNPANQRTASGLNAQAMNFNVGVTNNNTEFFNGQLDEMLIYNRALTAGEITGLYSAGMVGGGGYSSLGNLVLSAPTSKLVLGPLSGGFGNGAASFDSIAAAAGATIEGQVTSFGHLRPGNSPGTLNVAGDFTLAAGSTYHWETDGTPAGTDLVAVTTGAPGTGNLTLTNPWNLGISLGGLVPDGTYDLFTYQGALTPGTVNPTILKENAYAQLINTATLDTSVAGRVSINLDLVDLVEWNGTGTAWNQTGRWTPNTVPTNLIAAVVNNNATVATVDGSMPAQAAHTLVVDNGRVLVATGGDLQVANTANVTANGQLTVDGTFGAAELASAGATTFNLGATVNVPLIRVLGGTTSGPTYPSSARVALPATTTVQVEAGTLAGGFTLANTSTTAGSYAVEAQNGLISAHLTGPTASLRKSTAGTVDLAGDVNLNSVKVEAGTLRLPDGYPFQATTVNVTGGDLWSGRHVATIGTLQLDGGNATLGGNAGTQITTALQGVGTLTTESDVTIDASTAFVNFSGTLHVTDNSPASAGRLTVIVPSAPAPPPGAVAYWKFDNAGNLGLDSAGAYNGTLVGSPAPTAAAGRVGGAIDLERDASNYIDLPDGFADFSSGVTVAGWVNYESFTTWNRLIDFGTGAGANNVLFARNGTSADIRWELHSTAGGVETHDLGGGPLQNGQWYHVAASVAPGATNACLSSIYVNGVLRSTKTDSTLPSNVTRTLNYIGESNWAADDFLDGLVDELLVYNRALSTGEVQSLYQAGVAGAYTNSLGNAVLDPGTQLSVRGAGGGPGSALFTTIGTTGGPTVAGGIVLGNDLTAGVQKLTINGTATAANFQITGPGTVALDNSVLTVNAGGTLGVPSGVTLESLGNSTINAASAGLSFQGGLKVTSGTLTLNAPPGPGPVPSGAIARWTFDAAANLGADSTGNYNGTLMSNNGTALPTQAAGMIGGALRFTVANQQYVQLPAGMSDFSTGMTLAGWVYYTPSVGTWARIFDFGNGSANNNVLLARNGTSTNLTFEVWNGTTSLGQQTPTGVLPTGQWVFVTQTLTPGGSGTNTSTIYINGQLAPNNATRNYTSLPNVLTRNNNYIGKSNWADGYMDGYMDELVVYSRALTAPEVLNLYRAGIQGGYGAARFGDLDMAANTQINVPNGQPVGFSTAALGDGARITDPAGVTIDRTLTPNPFGTYHANLDPNVNPTITGPLTLSDGLVYEWSFGKWDADLITILGDLNFDKSFTLRIFGMGGAIQPTDVLPLFLYTGNLTVGGSTQNPLQYAIEIANLTDGSYVWDLSGASIQVGLYEGQNAVYLTGLSAAAIPEPGTLALTALGLAALLRRRRGRAR